MTRLLAGFSLLGKKPKHLNLQQILGDFFPNNQKAMFAICPFCLKKLKCLEILNPSLAQFKRTHSFQGTGAQVCLASCPDIS